jgi:transcriptional antiterminator
MELLKEEKDGSFYYKVIKGDNVLDIGKIENLTSKAWKELEIKLKDFGDEELLELVREEIKKHPRIESIDIEPVTATDDVAL